MKKQKQALLHVDVMNAARTEKSTIYIQLFRTFNSTGFQGSMLSFIRGRRVVADVPICEQWFRSDCFSLYTYIFTLTHATGSLYFPHIQRRALIKYITVWRSFNYISVHWRHLRIFLKTFLGSFEFWRYSLKLFHTTQILFKFIINRKQVLSTIKRYCS